MPTFTSDDGLTLSYRDEGQGLPVLLLHGFPLSGESFRPQLAALSDRFRFIVPDHRGFGQSTLGTGPTEMSRIARDALTLLDTLNIPQAVVGGVSMGGYASMALVREEPNRVKALVLIDTQVGGDDSAGLARREETARSIERSGVEVLVQAMVPKLLAPGAPEALKETVEGLIRGNRPEGAAAATRGMALRPDSSEILARFSGPTLIVVGEHDSITPLEKAQKMQQLVPGAQLTVIPGAGHLSNQEAPGRFNAVFSEFLERLSP